LIEIESMLEDRIDRLYSERRMEERFLTFEHMTLASLAAQTEQDFFFIILASDHMPLAYKYRLENLCARYPQVILRFFPVISVDAAQNQVFSEMGISYSEVLQFRLDDDDCVCVDYIETLKKFTLPFMAGSEKFSVTFNSAIFSSFTGSAAGIYEWPIKFVGAGVGLRHTKSSIFRFGHYSLSEKFLSIHIPRGFSLITNRGNNDTSEISESRAKKRKMKRLSDVEVNAIREQYFPFLTNQGRIISGLD